MTVEITEEEVLALGDATVLGCAKKGVLVTKYGIHFNSGAKGKASWSEIQHATSLTGFGNHGLELKLNTGHQQTIDCIGFSSLRANLELLINQLAAFNQRQSDSEQAD